MDAEGTILYTIYRDACGLAPGLSISLPSPYAQPTASGELAESTEEPSYGFTPFKLRLAHARACCFLGTGAVAPPLPLPQLHPCPRLREISRWCNSAISEWQGMDAFATLIRGRPLLRVCMYITNSLITHIISTFAMSTWHASTKTLEGVLGSGISSEMCLTPRTVCKRMLVSPACRISSSHLRLRQLGPTLHFGSI
jgi:hypothetical protein